MDNYSSSHWAYQEKEKEQRALEYWVCLETGEKSHSGFDRAEWVAEGYTVLPSPALAMLIAKNHADEWN